MFRSLKNRKLDSRGRVKQPQYRMAPVPEMLIENLDLVYGIRALQKKGKGLDIPLWTMSRPTAYRLVKQAMDRAGSVGKQATGKGIRGCKPEPPKFPYKPCVLKSWHLSQLTRSIGQQNNRVCVITMSTRSVGNGKAVHVITLFLLKRGWFYENNSKKDW